MNPFYTLVADRAAHRCEYCHAPELVFNFPFEVEHIVPLYRGGADTDSISLLRVAPAIFVKELASVESLLNPVRKFVCLIQGKTNGTTISK